MFKGQGIIISAIALCSGIGLALAVQAHRVDGQASQSKAITLVSNVQQVTRHARLDILSTELILTSGKSPTAEYPLFDRFKELVYIDIPNAKPRNLGLPIEGINAAAFSNASQTAVYLSNTSDQKVCIELRFATHIGVNSFSKYDLNTESYKRPERLESLVLEKNGYASKSVWVSPGAVTCVSLINRNYQLAQTFAAADREIKNRFSAGGAWTRSAMAPLDETRQSIGALLNRDNLSRTKMLQLTHRAIHSLAQSQALLRNSANANGINSSNLSKIVAAFERVETTLSEMSIGCLNLVAGVEETRITDTNQSHFTVHVQNCGKQSVSSLMIGLSGTEGMIVQPAESALFNDLGPGQTVRAEFTVDVSNIESRANLLADVAYSSSHSLAHLRLSLN